MPLTPLHYPIAYLLYRLNKRLNYPALIVGCFFPDSGTPVFYLFTRIHAQSRLLLQSLLGAATIGTSLAAGLTVLIYPRLVSYLFGFDFKEIKNRCQISLALVLSSLLGNLSHVLLDLTTHACNPLLWPILPASHTFNPICPLLGGPETAGLIGASIMSILLIGVLIHAYTHGDFRRRLLVGE